MLSIWVSISTADAAYFYWCQFRCLVNIGTMGMNSLPKTCYLTASRLRFELRPFSTWVQHANHLATIMWKLEVDGKMVSECLGPGMLAHRHIAGRTDNPKTMSPTDWPSPAIGQVKAADFILSWHITHTHTQQFNGPLSWTTRVGQYQIKHSPTQIHPDRQTSYINFLHLLRSMVYSSMAYVILQVN